MLIKNSAPRTCVFVLFDALRLTDGTCTELCRKHDVSEKLVDGGTQACNFDLGLDLVQERM